MSIRKKDGFEEEKLFVLPDYIAKELLSTFRSLAASCDGHRLFPPRQISLPRAVDRL